MTPKILIVDDDTCVRDTLVEMLELEGFTAQPFASAEGVLTEALRSPGCVVLTDLRMPGRDGLELLGELRDADPELPVLLMSGHGDIPMAIQAVREGAEDFLEKPLDPRRLIERLWRACRRRQWALSARVPAGDAMMRSALDQRVLGESKAIARLREQMLTIARAGVDTLIFGETGSGKDLIARALHEAGRRQGGPFIAINCGAIPESLIESELFGHEAGAFTGATRRRIGKIEAASGGTLLLDEIESMPLSAQVRLLRVLQERSLERLGGIDSVAVDITVIAACKCDLRALCEAGEFRHDLYYRLDVASLRLPPLRERREDIEGLFAHFCRIAAKRYGGEVPDLRPSHLERLRGHPWPGNVRELQHVAERFVLGIVGDGLNLGAGGATVLLGEEETGDFDQRMEAFERRLIKECLDAAQGQLDETADRLGLSRKTLYRKMKKHRLDRRAFRQPVSDTL